MFAHRTEPANRHLETTSFPMLKLPAMGKEGLVLAYEKKLAFIQAAIAEGALSQVPPRTKPEQWEKQQDIGITDAFGDQSLKALGIIFQGNREKPLTGTRIRQLSKIFLRNIWNNSSSELQACNPLEEILSRKQKARENSSRARGGKSIGVRELVEGGTTDPKKIQNTLGLSSQVLTNVRTTLKGWGVTVPLARELRDEAFERIRKEDDDKKLQELLDNLPREQLRKKLYGAKSGLFASVSKTAREAGLTFRNTHARTIAETLRNAGIPVRSFVVKSEKRELRYWVILAKHRQRAIEIINTNPDLRRFR